MKIMSASEEPTQPNVSWKVARASSPSHSLLSAPTHLGGQVYTEDHEDLSAAQEPTHGLIGACQVERLQRAWAQLFHTPARACVSVYGLFF